MDTTANEELVRRYFEELWNAGKVDRIPDIIAEDAVVHFPSLAGPFPVMPVFARRIKADRAAFPDLEFNVQDMIAAGDKVVARWIMSGTHMHEYRGIPATGKRTVVGGIGIYRVAAGRMAEMWVSNDDLGIIHQLGGRETTPASAW
jgi:steroid delta-isomerase-like uncharacterized protein